MRLLAIAGHRRMSNTHMEAALCMLASYNPDGRAGPITETGRIDDITDGESAVDGRYSHSATGSSLLSCICCCQTIYTNA